MVLIEHETSIFYDQVIKYAVSLLRELFEIVYQFMELIHWMFVALLHKTFELIHVDIFHLTNTWGKFS